MGKFRVKQRTKYTRKRRGFCGNMKKKDANINESVNIVNNTSCSDVTEVEPPPPDDTIMDISASSVSSQKVKVFKAATPNEKDKIRSFY